MLESTYTEWNLDVAVRRQFEEGRDRLVVHPVVERSLLAVAHLGRHVEHPLDTLEGAIQGVAIGDVSFCDLDTVEAVAGGG